jgi:hypothetical protein
VDASHVSGYPEKLVGHKPPVVALGAQHVVTIQFTVQKDGKLNPASLIFKTESGDKAGICSGPSKAVVIDSAPFDRLQTDWVSPGAELRMMFVFNKQQPDHR